MVSIVIQPITYDDDNLDTLYMAITKAKGVKNPEKNFSAGVVTIMVNYKGKADGLWQCIPKEKRAAFQMIEMSDVSIAIKPTGHQ